jgi:alpha,alpha-trehalase
MKKTTLILITLFLWSDPAQTKVQTPDQVYGELLKMYRCQKFFRWKNFCGLCAKRDPKEIVKDYLAIKNPAIKFSLELFVKENFELPPPANYNYIQQEKDV